MWSAGQKATGMFSVVPRDWLSSLGPTLDLRPGLHFFAAPRLGCDFNVPNSAQFVEKLRYIHRNPVKAGLCERPEDWDWSSFRHYATGCEGRVEIESEWTARKRERAQGKLCSAVELPPLKPKRGLNGPRV